MSPSFSPCEKDSTRVRIRPCGSNSGRSLPINLSPTNKVFIPMNQISLDFIVSKRLFIVQYFIKSFCLGKYLGCRVMKDSHQKAHPAKLLDLKSRIHAS